jgi:hypothetical protein
VERKCHISKQFKEMPIPHPSTYEALRPSLGPLTALTGVRFPLGLPENTLEKSRVFLYLSDKSFLGKPAKVKRQ